MKLTKTVDYYNLNAKDFMLETISIYFEMIQKRFINLLPRDAFILDFGCGSGRDTKYFLTQGYRVEAIDGSIELCNLASQFTGIEVKNMLFQELDEIDKYNGIWACSSILHLPQDELVYVMKRMVKALKDNGIIYTSFKYGNFEGERNGRYFTDMTEDSFTKFLRQIKNVIIEDKWITTDTRPGRGEEKWLNLILRKK